MPLQITELKMPKEKYPYKCPYVMVDSEGLTIHETGNIASAMAEASYMQGHNLEISWHIAIDDIRAVIASPLTRNTWQSGDGGIGFGNRKTISLEHCFNWTGGKTTKGHPVYDDKYHKAIANGVEMSAQLFLQYPKWGVPESGKNMWRHFDHSKKNCPQRLIEEGKWLDYVERVKNRYLELIGKPVVAGAQHSKSVVKPKAKSTDQLAKEVIDGKHGSGSERKQALGSQYNAVQARVNEMLKPKPVAKPQPKPVSSGIVKKYPETGSFKADYTIIVRDQPSITGNIIARYYKGEVLDEYHTVHIGNGHVWLQYDRMRDGRVIGQGYIPCREYNNGKPGELWGQLK